MYKDKNTLDRRSFLRLATLAGAGLSVHPLMSSPYMGSPGETGAAKEKRIGIIGLDTSHSEVFARMINTGAINSKGYKVTVAYHPSSNRDILNLRASVSDSLQKAGVKIADSMDALLSACDAVLLETIDGGSHLEQVLPVFEAKKRVFIDKPLSAALEGARAIADASVRYGVPFFSSSSLRFDPNVQKVVSGSIGAVKGADVYTPAELEDEHLDMAWYAIHGLEMLYAVMGSGCESVSRVYTPDVDVITAIWKDGRIGTLRGVRNQPAGIAGTAFGEKGTAPLGPFGEKAYIGLVQQIIDFFETGVPPVTAAETLEMFRFMEAADRSKATGKKIRIS